MNPPDDDIFSQMNDERDLPLRTTSRANSDILCHKMDNGQISKLSVEKKYSARLANVEKQELGNILHQYYGEQENKKNSSALSPSTLSGAPLRSCNITVSIAYVRVCSQNWWIREHTSVFANFLGSSRRHIKSCEFADTKPCVRDLTWVCYESLVRRMCGYGCGCSVRIHWRVV